MPVNPLRMLVVFALGVVIDIAWGYYIRRAAQGRALQAANWAVALMAFGAFNAISYIGNPWHLLPAVAGNWVGTYWVVRRDHRSAKG